MSDPEVILRGENGRLNVLKLLRLGGRGKSELRRSKSQRHLRKGQQPQPRPAGPGAAGQE